MKSTGIVVVALLLACGLASGQIRNKGWWKNAVFYQIYPRSFMDLNGDGVGDLPGITSKLDHFRDSGITAIWLSPINRSPMKDFGYDISDFKDVDSTFGNLNDLMNLINAAHKVNIKVILDLVPNHTSDQHYWFQMSVKRIGKYTNYYIWSDGKPNATGGPPLPPNNWISVFNGSAWTYNSERKQLYFRQFYAEQPDLNYTNPDVRQEMEDIMRYWLDRGIDGFRIDAVPHLFEGNITLNETLFAPNLNASLHVSYNHTLTKDQPETYELVRSWRKFVDKYAEENQREEIVLMTEAYTSLPNTIKFYNYGSDVPFNFKFITDVNATSTATDFKNIIDNWIKLMPQTGVANWVMGNHDRVRIATRYPNRADQMTMLAMILPGVAVTYYGEEIGMEDNSTLFKYDFRDGCRTPFQWNDSTNAGFSSARANQTWLPVHEKYKDVNLAKQKTESGSHYKLYTELIKLRKSNALKEGSLQTVVVNKDVLAVIRKGQSETVTLLINFNNANATKVDISKAVSHSRGNIYASSVGSGLTANGVVELSTFNIPAKASVVLLSGASAISCSALALLLLAFVTLFRS